MSDLPIQEFINHFVDEFPAYSPHEVESWFLNVVKNAALSNGYMPSHVISQVTAFACVGEATCNFYGIFPQDPGCLSSHCHKSVHTNQKLGRFR